MPQLHRLSHSKVTIHMYPDHVPPHVHVYGPGWEATVNLDDFRVGRGQIPTKVLPDVLAWMADNKDFLTKKWREINERD